jgi:hypothetical protein
MQWLFDFFHRTFRKQVPSGDLPPPLPTPGPPLLPTFGWNHSSEWTEEDEIRWEISHYDDAD